MSIIKISTAFTRMFFLGGTGLFPNLNISVNGGAFGGPSSLGGVSEIANGWYSYAFGSSDITTVGIVAYDIEASGTHYPFEDTAVANYPGGDAVLAASQPNYAPSKAGDAMTLTSAYDPAKTAAQAVVKQNTALVAFKFVMTDSTTHQPLAGLTVTAQVSIDNGAFGAATNSPAAISDGAYAIDLAAADTNGKTILLKFTATGADTKFIELITSA